MNLGQKLKQARQELGLSQRQLCGEVITRNMLSLIENGSASPSMETLRYLAGRLGKSVSYFLEEDTITSPNQTVMSDARAAFARKEYDLVLQTLHSYQRPDQVFDFEEGFLRALTLLHLAEEAIACRKLPYALELLEKAAAAGKQTPYFTEDLERRRLLALAQLLPVELPTDDRELLLRAEAALKRGEHGEATRYLEATQLRSGSYWNYLRGQTYIGEGDYARAQDCLEAAWDYDPKACAALLELCCREREDFKGAYRYACFLREWGQDTATHEKLSCDS